ncbi:MAG: ethanolamine ammonia-lyase reactivating factor EutA, partial [Planctomycetes bacterium]|nr:ethanolamine ammonia-lyase reactivating factor EutA [Planctomycetota bacterium]
ATVIGASQYTTQVSGSTIFIDPLEAVPVRNVPVIVPDFPLNGDEIDQAAIKAAVESALARLDLVDGRQPVAVGFHWDGLATFARLDAFCSGVRDGLEKVLGKGHPMMLVSDGDKQSYQGSFVVQQYQLEPVRLEVDTDRTVYYRGEEIEGTIKASYYYGAPLVGKEIRYRLQNGPVTTAKTDERGEVKFKLATREFRESQVLGFVVTLPERNLQQGKNFFLSTYGFSLSAETLRSVYLAGETFELTVEAADAEGKGVQRDIELHVLEKTHVNGQVGEVLVEKHELKTNDKGKVTHTLRLEKGGDFVLRVEGVDRFENVVSAETRVRISDDKDEDRLRILADRHTYKVGETAKLRLHWREAPALALVTYQGARILEYKLYELQKGSNNLQIPMTAKLAPNFHLSVHVMTDKRPKKADKTPPRRFHSSSTHFTVQRDLRVQLTVKRKNNAKGQPLPGEDIEVTIVTTDPQGKPVSAEVSIAMVEQTLLDRFSSSIAAIDTFFRGANRQPAVRTTSSITFDYRPATQPINIRLLAEQDRLELLEAEESRLAVIHAGDANNGEDGVGIDGDAMVDRPPLVSDPGNVVTGSNIGLPGGIAGGGFFGGPQSGNRGSQQMEQPGPGIAGPGPDGTVSGEQSGKLRQIGQLMERFNSLMVEGRYQEAEGDVPVPLLGWRGEQQFAQNESGGEIAAAELSTNPESVRHFFDQRESVQVLLDDGVWNNVNFKNRLGEKWDGEKAKALARELAADGALLLPQLRPHETGYWNPSIVTNEKGEAVITITLPDRSTAWSFVAAGITTETLAGEATDQLTVKKELFGELQLPMAFTDGDNAEIIVTVHNHADAEGEIKIALKTVIGEKTTSEVKTLDAKLAKGLTQLSFKQTLELPTGVTRSGA